MGDLRNGPVRFWSYDELGEWILAGRALPDGALPLVAVAPGHPALNGLPWSVRLDRPYAADLSAIADHMWHGNDGAPVVFLAVLGPGDMGVPSAYRFLDPADAMPFAQAYGGRTELVPAGPSDAAYFAAWEARPGFAGILRRAGR